MKIDKLVFGGQAMGRQDNKVAFLWGALPGEEVEFRVTKNKKNYIEGIAEKIITSSPDRQSPTEQNFLCCSPWQILNYEKENFWKKEIAREVYFKNGRVELPADIEIISSENRLGYRNKMEFSFSEIKGEIFLSLFERGGKRKVQHFPCALADEAVNNIASAILNWVKTEKIPLYSLKSVIARSNGAGEMIVALFIKDHLKFSTEPDFSSLGDKVKGVQIYFSTHKSPASTPDEVLYEKGEMKLTADLLGKKLSFGLFSFFQIHLPVFRIALVDIEKFIDPESEVVDFYGGVGSISIPLADKIKKGKIIEIVPEAVGYAQANIIVNKLRNFSAECLPSEKALAEIKPDQILIFDPPRIGLHADMITAVLEKKPKRIIYLSCDLATHARDIGLLSASYTPVFWRLYNFFPGTPHCESLCVLAKK